MDTATCLMGRPAKRADYTKNETEFLILGPWVRIPPGTAWIDYINRGSVFDGKTTTQVTWLESAVLMHGKTGWQIRFFHSTQVPAPKAAK